MKKAFPKSSAAWLIAAVSVVIGLALFGCDNPTSSSGSAGDSQRGVKGQISGIVLDGSTGLPLSGVKVEIAGKTATTDNAGYYVVSNVIPNAGVENKGENYTVSFYKDGYTAAQDADIYVDPNEYKKTDPYLEKQILLKLEDYFNTWLTQSAGNGTKIVTGTVTAGEITDGNDTGTITSATFWGTINDAGDIIGGSIKGTVAGAPPVTGDFTATVTGGNVNLGGITISGSIVGNGTPIHEGVTAIQINPASLNITSAAGGNWTYAGGVYINEEDGTAVQVTSDPQSPEVPKFELKPLDYVYHYGQSLETVYLYPMNASISGKILTFHNNTDVPVGVPNIKIEFSNVPSPVVGDQLYTAPVDGNIKLVGSASNADIATATFVGYYDTTTHTVSGTINGKADNNFGNFTGTVTGTVPSALVFSGTREDGAEIENDTTPLTLAVADLSPVGANTNQAGRFYGEGKTNAKGEFTVKGVPAGQALYIQIPGFTDKEGRYYSGSTLFSVKTENNESVWRRFSAGPWVSQRNATVALPTIYLRADADIALVVESTLGTPQERLKIKGEGDEPTLLTVTFSKEMDTKTFSAKITTNDGAKGVGANPVTINLDVVKWEDSGKNIKTNKVTLKADNTKIPGYYQSGLLPYWTGDAENLSVGVLSFGDETRAADGSILVNPVTADEPKLPVFTEIGLNLEKVEVIEASQSSRSILQQGGEVRLYFNKEVAETEGTKFDFYTNAYLNVLQAWKVDATNAKIIHVYNDRPTNASADLVTSAGYGVRSVSDQLNDVYDIAPNEIDALAAWNADTEFLTILENPYLDKTDTQGKLNAQKVGTNLKIGTVDGATKTDADNDEWDPIKDIVLEFNKTLSATPTVRILYSPSEGVYVETIASVGATYNNTTNRLTIPLSGTAAPLLAPGATYYLAFTAEVGGVDVLKVDPAYTAKIGGLEVGPNIKIKTEAESSTRFTELDATKASSAVYPDGFSVVLPAIEEYSADLTFDDWTYNATAVSANNADLVKRSVQLYILRNGAWEPVKDATPEKKDIVIDIEAGYSFAIPIPAFTIPNYGAGNFPFQFRGVAHDGRVLKYAGTMPTATPPTATYDVITTVPSTLTSPDITAYQGIALSPTPYLTINLSGTPGGFKAFDEEVDLSDPDSTITKPWFTNLPEGLKAYTAYAVASGDTKVVIKLTGEATDEIETSFRNLEAVIPGSAVKYGVNLPVGRSTGTNNDIRIRVQAPKVEINGLYNKGSADTTPPPNSRVVNFIIGSSTPLADNAVTLVLTLSTGNIFTQAIPTTEPLTSWFVNIPEGLTARPLTPVSVGESRIEVALEGAPTERSDQAIQIKIPGGVTRSVAPIYNDTTVTGVPRYRYNVTSLLPGTANIAVYDGGANNIAGPAGIPLATARYYRIRVTGNNDAFVGINQDVEVTNWFNLADYGLKAHIAYRVQKDDEYAIVKITGAPSKIVLAAASQPLTYVIPKDFLRNGLAIKGGVSPAIYYDFTAPSLHATTPISLTNQAGTAITEISGFYTTPATPIAPVNLDIELSATDVNMFKPIAAGPLTPIRAWIPNAPLGLSLSTSGLTGYDKSLTLTISGAPTEQSIEWLEVVVPASATISNQPIHYTPTNAFAFSIKPNQTIVTAEVTGGSSINLVEGIPLPSAVDYTITLTNDTFDSSLSGSVTWFNLPGSNFNQALRYPVYAGDTEAVVRVTGSANAIPAGAAKNMVVTIPGNVLDATPDASNIVATVPTGYVYEIVQATATATDGTVSGTVGAIIPYVDITITLQGGNTFTAAYAADDDIISWIPVAYRVTGLSYKVKTATASGATSLVLKIGSDTPVTAAAVSTERIVIVIPGAAVLSGSNIPISTSANRVYAITP